MWDSRVLGMSIKYCLLFISAPHLWEQASCLSEHRKGLSEVVRERGLGILLTGFRLMEKHIFLGWKRDEQQQGPWEVYSRDLASLEWVFLVSRWWFFPVVADRRISWLRGQCPLRANSWPWEWFTNLTCSRNLWLTLTLRDQSRVANSSKCFRKLCVNSEEPKWVDVLRWGWVPASRNLPVEPSNLAKYRAFSTSQGLPLRSGWEKFWLWKHLLLFTLMGSCLVKGQTDQWGWEQFPRGPDNRGLSLFWSIIAFQCCVGFCYSTKWIGNMYTHMPFLLNLLPTPLSHHRAPSPGVLRGFSWSRCGAEPDFRAGGKRRHFP